MLGAEMKSSIATIVASVDVATSDQEKMNGFNVTLPNGVVQWS